MTAHDQRRPSSGRGIQARAALAAMVGFAAAAGCTGDNLFTGPTLGGGGGLLGPTVTLSAPAADAVVALGDSVQVTAKVTSDNGVNEVTFSGVFASGSTAFITQVVTLSNATDTTISRFLKQAGTATGSAKIIVQAKDILGGTGADTVSVTIS
jgi:hypothetical protein